MAADDDRLPYVTIREFRAFEHMLTERLERLGDKIDDAVRDLIREQEKRIDQLAGRVSRLESWRSRAAGALGVLSFAAGLSLPFVARALDH